MFKGLFDLWFLLEVDKGKFGGIIKVFFLLLKLFFVLLLLIICISNKRDGNVIFSGELVELKDIEELN